MKIVVWQGCRVLSEQEFEGDGPDIHVDPTNLPEQIGIRRFVDGRERHEFVYTELVAR